MSFTFERRCCQTKERYKFPTVKTLNMNDQIWLGNREGQRISSVKNELIDWLIDWFNDSYKGMSCMWGVIDYGNKFCECKF